MFVAVLGLGAAVGSAQAWGNTVTPMCTTAQIGPVQCQDGWYTTAVRLNWTVLPLPQTTSQGCDTATTFNTDTNEIVECDATWSSPPDIQYPYQVRVEVSSPTASALPARPPDSNGWYNHPVAVLFAGSAFSGISSCTPATTYGGPGTLNATISGTCKDNAGKTANASLSLNYDDTPPAITGATAARKPDSKGYYTHPVAFIFAGTDGVSGISNCDTVTYSGPSSGNVVGGCHDQAGNYATIAVPVKYRAATPAAAVKRAKSPLVLRWKPARRASYYNVQIYRAGKKVLSSWPSHARLQLRRSWSFAGHKFRLKPGRYRWYVWPGYGSRAAARYGHRIVSGTFKVPKQA